MNLQLDRDWRSAARVFDERADEYDRWYRDNPLFAIECAALKAIRTPIPPPRLEIGVGPGHFARALDTGFGLDPAIAPLHLAANRGIIGIRGIGEHLPLRSACLGTVYLLFTFCFLAEPAVVLAECRRVLKDNGVLVIGLIPALSNWGRRLTDRAAAGHPCYRHARLRTVAETVRFAETNGFALLESWSTLRQEPGTDVEPESPLAKASEEAGFCVLIFGKQGGEK